MPVDWTKADWLDGSRLSLFHLHYHDYLQQLPVSDVLALILDWIETNPARSRTAWIAAWHPYVISVRVVAWMQWLAERGQDEIPEDVRRLVSRSAVAQVRYLARRLELDVEGNHLVKNARALLWAGSFFSGDEPLQWQRRGERLLARILSTQILADGFHFERSPGYHLQVLSDLIDCRVVTKNRRIVGHLDRTLTEMAQVAVDITHPDGLVSNLADGGLHMTAPVDEIVASVSAITGLQPPSPRAAFAFEDAGYFGWRSARLYLIVDCGPIGPDELPAHGHGDILSFELDVDGRRFVVDPGVYEYRAGPWRTYARSTAAHNTVALDGLDQAEFWSSFRVGRRPRLVRSRTELSESRFLLEGSHDGYRHLPGTPTHVRRIRADELGVSVHDLVSGGAGQGVLSSLLLHPEVGLEQVDSHLLRLTRDDVEAWFWSDSPIELTRSHWSPDLGERYETWRILLDYGSAPTAAQFHLRLDRPSEGETADR